MSRRIESNAPQFDMETRDAVVRFECFPPGFVQVSEMVDGEYVRHATVQRDPRVVTEMERKYIFFAKQASIAKKQVKFWRSCVFSVYRREP
jgi:hypothetical protein